MILIIDTTPEESFTIALARSHGVLVYQKNIPGRFIQAEKLLPAIEKILKTKKIKFTDLSGIAVVQGPGGFTAVRIGVITANALAYALHIPVVGFKQNEFSSFNNLSLKSAKKLKKAGLRSMVVPHYGREPNITKPKKSFKW